LPAARCARWLAQVDPGNLPSTRVVEKLGFRGAGAKTGADHDDLVQWLATRRADR
jgi:RimJ/RimL family protein N-acetyltransferase